MPKGVEKKVPKTIGWVMYCVSPGAGGVTRSKTVKHDSDVFEATREALDIFGADVIMAVRLRDPPTVQEQRMMEWLDISDG